MAVLRVKDENGKLIEIHAIKGEKGADGTMTFSDLTEEQKASLKGDKGDSGPQGPQGEKGETGAQGPQGAQGIQGIQGIQGKTGPAGADGTKGDKGDPGEKGADGAQGPAGYTPQKGTDYWTAADKSEMVSDVLAALPTWEGGTY